MTCSDIINLITAGSTFLLAFVALFGESVKRRIYSPKIKLELKNPSGDFTTFLNEIERYTPAYCYHIVVMNYSKRSIAHNCYVQIIQIEKLLEKGTQEIKLNVPVYIRWVPNELGEFAIDLSHERLIDFGFLKQNGTSFRPWLQTYPNNFSGFVEPHTTLIYTLQAFADAYKSKKFKFSVTWNGEFSEDSEQMSKNLIIKQI